MIAIKNFSRKSKVSSYDQFSFDPLAEFRFPNKEVHLRRVQTVNSPISRLYSREIFSGQTPDDPLEGDDPTQLGRYAYFYSDHRYDVTSILKHSGQSLHSYLYDEYGLMYDNNKKPHDASNFTQSHNLYTFSQKEFDPESSLSYFGARYYDPFSGTWTTQDIVRGNRFNPLTLHRYAYVLNNPINLIDRFGFNHEKISPENQLLENDLYSTNLFHYLNPSLLENIADSTPRFSFVRSILLAAKTFLDQLQPSLKLSPAKPNERLQRKIVFIPQPPEPTVTIPVAFTALTASVGVGTLRWVFGGEEAAVAGGATSGEAIAGEAAVAGGATISIPAVLAGLIISVLPWDVHCAGCSEPVAPPGGWEYEQSLPQEQSVPKVQPLAVPKTATPQPPGQNPCSDLGTKPSASNPALQRAINELYRSTDIVPGGTAGAIRHQLSTGELVGGRDHVIKAQERIRNLRKILRKENLSSTDKAMAECLIEDLTRALAGD